MQDSKMFKGCMNADESVYVWLFSRVFTQCSNTPRKPGHRLEERGGKACEGLISGLWTTLSNHQGDETVGGLLATTDSWATGFTVKADWHPASVTPSGADTVPV